MARIRSKGKNGSKKKNRIAVETETLVVLEIDCSEKLDQISKTESTLKLCQQDKLNSEQDLVNCYNLKIGNRKFSQQFQKELENHQQKLIQTSTKLNLIMKEVSHAEEFKAQLNHYLQKSTDDSLTNTELYYWDKVKDLNEMTKN